MPILVPTLEGKYHKTIAHGMSHVTSHLPKINLTELNQEMRELGVISEDTILPRKVGGAPVQLLIGIKNIPTIPKLLYRTEQGLAVFESPFADKWGSHVCYAGTHSSFTAHLNGGQYPRG